MLGPSYALYSLCRNDLIRQKIEKSERYGTLRGRFVPGSLVGDLDTPPWRVRTPNKSDVLVMIASMIKAVDEGLFYDGIGSVPQEVPVEIQHLSDLGVWVGNSMIHALQLLPGLATGLVQGTATAISRGANRFLQRSPFAVSQDRATTPGRPPERPQDDPSSSSQREEARIAPDEKRGESDDWITEANMQVGSMIVGTQALEGSSSDQVTRPPDYTQRDPRSTLSVIVTKDRDPERKSNKGTVFDQNLTVLEVESSQMYFPLLLVLSDTSSC